LKNDILQSGIDIPQSCYVIPQYGAFFQLCFITLSTMPAETIISAGLYDETLLMGAVGMPGTSCVFSLKWADLMVGVSLVHLSTILTGLILERSY